MTTNTRTFGGVEVTLPEAFTEGYTLTAAQAERFTALVATAAGNALGSSIRKAIEAETDARKSKKHDQHGVEVTVDQLGKDWQEAFNSTFQSIATTAPKASDGTGQSKDPIASLARSLAEVDLVARINRKGMKPAQFRTVKMEDGRTKFSHLLDAQYDSGKEDYLARAKAQMEPSTAAAAQSDDSDLDLAA